MALASSNAHAYRLYIVKALGKIRSTEAPPLLFPNFAVISEALNYNRFQSNLSNLKVFRPPPPTSPQHLPAPPPRQKRSLELYIRNLDSCKAGEDFLKSPSGCCGKGVSFNALAAASRQV